MDDFGNEVRGLRPKLDEAGSRMPAIPRALERARQGVSTKRVWIWQFAALAAILATAGCTRAYYHDYADNDVYRILKERLFDWRWQVPERAVEAPPESRMAD